MIYAHMQFATSWPEHLLAGFVFFLQVLAVMFFIAAFGSAVGWIFGRWPVGSMIAVSIFISVIIIIRVT